MNHLIGFFSRYKKHTGIVLLYVFILLSIYIKMGFNGQFLVYGILMLILTAAAVTDIHEKIIPNKLVILGSGLGGLMLPLNERITWRSALTAVILVGGLLWLTSVISKGAIGLGDVKLVACVSIYFGIEKILSVLFFASLLSAAVGLILVIKKVSNRKRQIPFAPFVLIGSLIVILL